MAKAHISELRVRYQETDQMQVVYHANYAIWFEVGRTNALRDAGQSYKELEQRGIMMPVVELHCKYKSPATYDDLIEIHTRIASFTGVKLIFQYQVLHKERQELLVEGETIHAFLQNGRPVSLKKKDPELAQVIIDLMEDGHV